MLLPALQGEERPVTPERRAMAGYLVVLAVLGGVLVWSIANCGQ